MKVQNEMSTRISVDAVSAIGSMSAFRNAIRGASDAWRAQEIALKNSGNFAEAAKSRLSGLNQVIDLQKAKVEELRQRQEGLDTSNQKQANQFLKLEKQIQQANKQLASYEGQAERAKNAARMQVSGLSALQHSYRSSQAASTAFVNRLKAEGRSASATVAKYRQLKSSLSNLESQYRKQEFILKQIANDSGKNSEAYQKQRIELDKTATEIAKTKNEMKSMQSTVSTLQPTGITKIDNAVIKVNDHTAKMRTRVVSAFSTMKDKAMTVGPAIAGIGVALGRGAQQAANLQDSYKRTTNLLVTGGEKASQAIKNVSKMQSDGAKMSVQYGISQSKIASAYQELTKRGYSSSQSLGAMKTMLQASVASGDDLNDVVTSSTAAMEAFGLRANGTAAMLRNTKKAVNEMAYAADMTATDFKSMSTAMEYAGPAAKMLGYSVGQTASAIGILSNNGLEADKAGTGLRQVMNSLIKPTKGANAALQKIGLSTKDFTDKSGKMKSMSDIFKELNDHTSNLSKQEKGAIFKALFGSTGESAGIILANNSKQLKDLNKNVEDSYKGQGYVQKLANKNMGSAKMAISQFKEAANATTITLGKALMPALRDASVAMAKAFNSKDGQRMLNSFAKGLGAAATAVVKLGISLSKHTTTLKIFGGAMIAAFASAKVLDGIGKMRARLDNLRAVINHLPKRKRTQVDVDSKSAQKGVQQVNKELKKVPKKTTSKVEVDSKSAVKNINAVGKVSKATATTSKISFASIRTAAVTSIRGIGLAVKANPLGALITGIQAAVVAFQWLYKNSKTFRNFVNGLKRTAQIGMKAVGKWFSSTFKNISKEHQRSVREQQKQNRQAQRDWDKHMRTLSRGWNNFWRNYSRTQSRNAKASQRTWNTLSRNTTRVNDRMWKSVRRSADNGWKNFEKSVQRGTQNVSRNYERMQQTTGRLLDNMRKQHPRTFNAMYKEIEDRSKMWHDLTSGHWNRLSGDTANIAKDMNNTSRSIFGDMYSKLNDLTGGGLTNIKNAWNDALNKIHDAIVNIGGTIHRAWDNLMNGIVDVFGGLINNIIKGINWVVDKVGGEGHIAEIKLAHFAQGSNGPIAKHQLAVLNDAPGEQYREMVHKHGTGKTFMLPAKRNIMMPLEPGDEVLDGKRSAEMMQAMGLPRYAGGAIGNFFSGVFNKVGDAIDDATDWVEKALKNIVEFGKELFSHFISPIKPKVNDVLGNGMKTGFPGYFAKALQKWMKKQLDQLSTANPPGTGVERWRPVIIRAFNALHVAPAEWKVNKLLRQIQTESNGDPNAFQHGYHDANSGGNEARGLLQFALRTWRADALPGHTDWHSGYNEILAAINVLEHGGEGGWGNVGNGHGWANGGLVTQHGIYEVAEGNNPEMIIPLDPNKRGRAYSLLSQVISQFKHEDSSDNATSANDANALGKKLDALVAQNQQLLCLIDKLIGVTDSVNNPTRRYRRTQHDINMAQFQSLT